MTNSSNIFEKSNFNSPQFIPLAGVARGNLFGSTSTLLVGMGTCGIGNGADLVFTRLQKYISETKASFKLKQTGCFGFCAEEPLVMLYQPRKPMLVYSKVDEKDAVHIADGLSKGKIYQKKILCRIDEWDFLTSKIDFGKGLDF